MKIILCFFVVLQLFAQETASQSENRLDKARNYFKTVSLVAELNGESRLSQSDNEIEDQTSRLGITIGASFPVYKDFSLGLYITDKSNFESEAETNRDEDIQDAAGKDIRLVERKIRSEFDEGSFLEYRAEHKKTFKNNSALVSYIGFSYSKGQSITERFDMTDRDRPILFSTHNRYYLTSTNDYTRKGTLVGVSYFFPKKMYVTLQYTYSAFDFNNTQRYIRTNGEEIAFNDSDFYFERELKNSANSISFGLGYYF